MPIPALLPLSSAALVLGGVSTRTVRRLIQDGALQAFHVRGRIMVRAESLDSYLAVPIAQHNLPGPVIQEQQPCEDSNH